MQGLGLALWLRILADACVWVRVVEGTAAVQGLGLALYMNHCRVGWSSSKDCQVGCRSSSRAASVLNHTHPPASTTGAGRRYATRASVSHTYVGRGAQVCNTSILQYDTPSRFDALRASAAHYALLDYGTPPPLPQAVIVATNASAAALGAAAAANAAASAAYTEVLRQYLAREAVVQAYVGTGRLALPVSVTFNSQDYIARFSLSLSLSLCLGFRV